MNISPPIGLYAFTGFVVVSQPPPRARAVRAVSAAAVDIHFDQSIASCSPCRLARLAATISPRLRNSGTTQMSTSPTHHRGDSPCPSPAYTLQHSDDAPPLPPHVFPCHRIPSPPLLPLPRQHLETEAHPLFSNEEEHVTRETPTDVSLEPSAPPHLIGWSVGENSNCASVASDEGDKEINDGRRPRRPVSYPCGPESEVQPPLRIELVGFDAATKRNSFPQKVIVA